MDVIERFFAKLEAEETKYRARMDELEVRFSIYKVYKKNYGYNLGDIGRRRCHRRALFPIR